MATILQQAMTSDATLESEAPASYSMHDTNKTVSLSIQEEIKGNISKPSISTVRIAFKMTGSIAMVPQNRKSVVVYRLIVAEIEEEGIE